MATDAPTGDPHTSPSSARPKPEGSDGLTSGELFDLLRSGDAAAVRRGIEQRQPAPPSHHQVDPRSLSTSLQAIAAADIQRRLARSAASASVSGSSSSSDHPGPLPSWSVTLPIVVRIHTFLTFAESASLAPLSSVFCWANVVLSLHQPYCLQSALAFGGLAARSQQQYLAQVLPSASAHAHLFPSSASSAAAASAASAAPAHSSNASPSTMSLGRVRLGNRAEVLANEIFKARLGTALDEFSKAGDSDGSNDESNANGSSSSSCGSSDGSSGNSTSPAVGVNPGGPALTLEMAQSVLSHRVSSHRGKCWLRMLGVDGYAATVMAALGAVDPGAVRNLIGSESLADGSSASGSGGSSASARVVHELPALKQAQRKVYSWFSSRAPIGAEHLTDLGDGTLGLKAGATRPQHLSGNGGSAGYTSRLVDWHVIDGILKDVPRTLLHRDVYVNELAKAFPAHAVSSPGAGAGAGAGVLGQFAEVVADSELREVLTVYAMMDRSLAYCQGMNFIAGLLLTQLTKEDALWAFSAIVNGDSLFTLRRAIEITQQSADSLAASHPPASSAASAAASAAAPGSSSDPVGAPAVGTAAALLPSLCSSRLHVRHSFLHNLAGSRVLRFEFLYTLRATLPRVYSHLQSISFPVDILSEWYMTLFASPSLPAATSLRLWDYLFATGTQGIISLSIAILSKLETKLISLPFEGVYSALKQVPRAGRGHLEPEGLVYTASLLVIPAESVQRLTAVAINGGVIA
jgi:hypothetical protein